MSDSVPGVMVLDATLPPQVDAFDGAGIFAIRGSAFAAAKGKHQGASLSTGPKKLEGLVVTRTDTAIQTMPALRTLVGLTNTTKRTIKRTVSWEGATGGDGGAEVIDSSDEIDTEHTTEDRWTVVSDEPGGIPSDPVLVSSFRGKGNIASPVKSVLNEPNTDEDDCTKVTYAVRIPSGKTSYLLFGYALYDTNASATAAAAADWNGAKPKVAFLQGLTERIRKSVLNWRL